MFADPNSNLKLEIGHVLFIDVVGYSNFPIEEQKELQRQVTQIVRGTDQFRAAEAQGKLVRLPTGDGMALVFFTTAEAPIRCALQVSEALQSSPQLRVRMGINTGPVSGTTDVNDRSNIAGAGINIAQRVMAFGDAGHILLSKRAAEDLLQYRQWQRQLHDLGEFEAKHGQKLHILNLYTDKLGNPQLPEKIKHAMRKEVAARRGRRTAIAGLLLLVVALPIGSFIFFRRTPTTQETSSAHIPDKSIAVLPFENLSANQENSYFTDGVQDEILVDLAKIADLKVISRTSVMQYKNTTIRNLREIAQQLGVAHILEGSVQRAANRVRVTVQLIDARTDTHLWANQYDRDLADVFAIQSEIAKTIANQLQAKLSPAEKAAIEKPPTADLAAFDLYSRAKTLLLTTSFSARTKDILLEAVDLLNQAVARDEKFFLAHAQLAFANDILYMINLDHTPARLAAGDAAVQAAVRLQSPDSGEAHLVLAEHLYRGYLDYNHARAEIALAQRTLPNATMAFELAGQIDRRRGRWEESIRNFEREAELDPRNLYILQQIALTYQLLRQYARMAAVLDRALAIAPRDVDTRVARAQIALDSLADPQPLHTMIDTIVDEDPTAAPTLADTWLNLALCERNSTAANRAVVALSTNAYRVDAVILSRDFIGGLMARVRGDTVAARAAFTTARVQQEALVRAQPDYGPAVCVLGLIDAGLGRKEDALREGRRAVQLLPVTRDAINGVHMIEFFAIICAWTGEQDLAFEQLTTAVRLPGWFSYGLLRLHPILDPLRSDPRFERIVAMLGPR